MGERSPQTQDKFVVRLPDGLRDRIKAAADASNRSMNAEIVATLEEKYPPTVEEDFRELVELISQLDARNPKDHEVMAHISARIGSRDDKVVSYLLGFVKAYLEARSQLDVASAVKR